jgi:para-nitrobenzyl esterase
MTSPLSKGLFRRVIAQSGAVVGMGTFETLPEAEKRGLAFAASLGLTGLGRLEALRATPVTDILKASVVPRSAPSIFTSAKTNLGIVTGTYVFPKDPSVVFARGEQHHVALMLGSNARERTPNTELPSDLLKTIQSAYGPLASQGVTLYQQSKVDRIYGTSEEQWATDTDFRCPSVVQLSWHARAGHPAYQYEFARTPQGRETVGATHASEVAYVFGTLATAVPPLGPKPEYSAVDQRISDAMQQYWTNFAKTGDPNVPDGSNLPLWRKFDTISRAFMQFTNAAPVPGEGLRRFYCDLYISHLKTRMH